MNITADQYHLIVDYQTMDHQSDSEIVIFPADRLAAKYETGSWSFDKGYWHPDNRALLEMIIPEVVMAKKGKCNREEREREHQKSFRKLRHRHSAIESNILWKRGVYLVVRTEVKLISAVMWAGRYVLTICVALAVNYNRTINAGNFCSKEQHRIRIREGFFYEKTGDKYVVMSTGTSFLPNRHLSCKVFSLFFRSR